MPRNEEADKERADLEAARRFLAAQYGKAYKRMVKRVMEHPEEITLTEWTLWITSFLHREETRESFNRAIAYCRTNKEFKLPIGKTESITVPLKPGLSRSFLEAWLTYVSVDAAVLFIDKYKDMIGYYAFLLEVSGTEAKVERRRITPMEALGLE